MAGEPNQNNDIKMSQAELPHDQSVQPNSLPPELAYLGQLIKYRLGKYFREEGENDIPEPEMPDLEYWQLPMKNFVGRHSLNKMEALVLLVAMAPHIQSDLFDSAIDGSLKGPGDFPKIGGIRGKNYRGFLPTGQTVSFLIGAENWESIQEVQQLFWSTHFFGMKKVLWLESLQQGEPLMSGRIILSQDYFETFTFGKPVPPHFSMDFPARQVTTQLTWSDLVISDELQEQVNELITWVKYNDQLLHAWGMEKRLVKGYRSLFYGPPGTGKTFTAGLIARELQKDLYKIDLSMVVSKYIGETEKNLELLFARAEDKGWILFFDEADALFGKRTNVRDAHDKYANQEVSYLLQRMEDFNGLIILATNMKNNIDEAFVRRFNSILKFSLPNPEERSRIWRKSFPQERAFYRQPYLPAFPESSERITLEMVDIPELVRKYELSGGSIMNVVHYASLQAVRRHNGQNEIRDLVGQQNGLLSGDNAAERIGEKLNIYLTDVLDGIRRELAKEGKPFVL
jgi:hypothetical protein